MLVTGNQASLIYVPYSSVGQVQPLPPMCQKCYQQQHLCSAKHAVGQGSLAPGAVSHSKQGCRYLGALLPIHTHCCPVQAHLQNSTSHVAALACRSTTAFLTCQISASCQQGGTHICAWHLCLCRSLTAFLTCHNSMRWCIHMNSQLHNLAHVTQAALSRSLLTTRI